MLDEREGEGAEKVFIVHLPNLLPDIVNINHSAGKWGEQAPHDAFDVFSASALTVFPLLHIDFNHYNMKRTFIVKLQA